LAGQRLAEWGRFQFLVLSCWWKEESRDRKIETRNRKSKWRGAEVGEWSPRQLHQNKQAGKLRAKSSPPFQEPNPKRQATLRGGGASNVIHPPFKAARHVAYPYDRPRALHRVPLCGLILVWETGETHSKNLQSL
jgi:hypothetical protein